MPDWNKIFRELDKESYVMYSLYEKGELKKAKKIVQKQIEKVDSMTKIIDDMMIKNKFFVFRRDRLVLLKVIELYLKLEQTADVFDKRITKVENNFKTANENIRKLNQRIDEWESGR